MSVLGLVLLAAAFVPLRHVIQIAPAPKAGGRLVHAGVYRFLRHPIYTAVLLLVVGLFLGKPTLIVGAAGAVVVAFLFVKVRLGAPADRPVSGYADSQDAHLGHHPGVRACAPGSPAPPGSST